MLLLKGFVFGSQQHTYQYVYLYTYEWSLYGKLAFKLLCFNILRVNFFCQ